MANYHCSVKIVSRSSGRSSTGAAAYRAAAIIHDERSGLTHDYRRKTGVDYAVIIAPYNVPDWAHDRAQLWNEVEKIERRKDAQLCREIEVSIPIELNNDQKIELVRGYSKSQFVDSGMIADVSFHNLDSHNPHAHVLLTMRDIDHNGFGNKNRDWNNLKLVDAWRMEWANHANRALELAGHDARIDHRSYKAQGINKIPQVHLGPAATAMERRGVKTEIGNHNREVDVANKNIIYLEQARERIDNEIRDLERERHEHGTNQTIEISRAVGNGDPAVSAGNGGTHRTDMGGTRGYENRSNETNAAARNISPAEHQLAKPGNTPVTGGNQRGDEAQQKQDTQNNIDGHRYCSAIDNIVALSAGAKTKRTRATSNEHRPGGEKPLGTTNTTPTVGNAKTNELERMKDKTTIAVNRQLAAMGCTEFEIGIRDSSGKMMNRIWSADQIRKSIGWMKRENAKGSDIYIRPAGDQQSHGLILVDDLNQAQITRMKSAGYEPALVVETSPLNYQAWIRVSDKPIPPVVATLISRAIAETFGGDPNSADWRHYGRLAGFTNAKPEHKNEIGQSPWILCQESTGRRATNGAELVQAALSAEQKQQAGLERSKRLKAAQNAPERVSGRDPVAEYLRQLKILSAQYGQAMDVSKADFMICKDMARRGYSHGELVTALEQASPELPIRKAGHEQDYCQRTVVAAINSLSVDNRPQPDQPHPKSSSPKMKF